MLKTIRAKLLLLFLIIVIATLCIFAFLIHYNNQITEVTAAKLGSMYMSEMMYQTQDHFDSIIELKNSEAIHIAKHPYESNALDPREILIETATKFEFDYLALYDDSLNYETIMGESAWYKNLSGFINNVKAEKVVATTGYLTKSGEKYLVFGVPATYEMENGLNSSVLLLGFNVKKLYDYIHVENLDRLGSDTRFDIILTNGSYVIKQDGIDDTSYFEHILQYGSFVDTKTEDGINEIETAMSNGDSFSHTVTLNGVIKHIYGASIDTPGNWYFILSMPQGATDDLLTQQNVKKLWGFGIAGFSIFVLFLIVFLFYLNMSNKQIAENKKAKNEADIANSAKSSFLSNMSHDIRTPMNAIAGFAAIAEDNIKKQKYQEALDAIMKMNRSTDYLRNLIGDVLDMSKIESGKLNLITEVSSLTQIAEMIDTIAKVRTETSQQKYDFYLHDVLHDAIICDQIRLNQVLINLIGNAIKFTPENGTIKFEVWQTPSTKGDEYIHTCFLIQDSGIGMSEEFLSSIFENFSREESRVRKIEGTGLGLAISKKLIDMMEGTITVDSKEGEGSTFYLEIDFIKTYENQKAENAEVVLSNTQNIKIIIAEDNDFNYEIANIMLSEYGFILVRAENGEEAFNLYSNSPDDFDLILMDLRMPILDGYEATKLIRKFESGTTMHIPIFALSADVFDEDVRKCEEVGMDGHISKPIAINELLGKIKRYIIK